MQMRQIWRAGGPQDADPASTWVEGLANAFVRLDFAGEREASFGGAIHQAEAGPMKISRVRAAPHCVRRLAEYARAARADVVFVNLQVSGVGHTAQGRRERRTGPFDIAVADTLAPFEIAHRQPFELVCAAIPRELIPPKLISEGGLALSKSQQGRDLASLMLGHVALIQNPASADAAVALASRHFLDLLGLAASEASEASADARPELTPEHIRDYIAQNFRDPLASASRVAAAFGVSERHVQKLLARSGDTFSEILAAVRLEACARDLSSEGAARRSVAAIAYEMGFSDLSHFHRSFKARFGETPAGFRGSLREGGR